MLGINVTKFYALHSAEVDLVHFALVFIFSKLCTIKEGLEK